MILFSYLKNDDILNKEFLIDELKIPEKHHNLFFDYLSSKTISEEYLKVERKLELIELIIKYAEEFKSKNSWIYNE